jgi:excisionase family DNA binding protein
MSQQSSERDEPRWRVDDVASYLQCSKSRVYKGAEAGTLPCVRLDGLLRFDPDQIRAYARGDLKRRPGGQLVALDAGRKNG